MIIFIIKSFLFSGADDYSLGQKFYTFHFFFFFHGEMKRVVCAIFAITIEDLEVQISISNLSLGKNAIWFELLPQKLETGKQITSVLYSHCNIVIFGAGAESSRSGCQMTIIIQNFTLVSLASTITPYPAKLLFRAMVLSYPTHLTTHSTPHCLRSEKVFPTLETICTLPTCQRMRLLFFKPH